MSPKTHLRSVAAALGIVLAPAIAVAQLQTEAPTPVAGATSKVADRFQNHVLPFFSRTLCADRACR